jgi:hypothetical protein
VAPHAVVEDSPGQDRVAAGGAVGRPVEEDALDVFDQSVVGGVGHLRNVNVGTITSSPTPTSAAASAS